MRRLDQRRPPGLRAVARRSVGPHLEEVFAAARAGSSSRASPRTSTACSRSSTPPTALGRKVALVGRSMRKNVNIGRSLGHIDVPEGVLVQAARDRRLPRRQARDHLDRVPGRAAVARCGAWPTATTRRSSCTSGDTVVFSATPIPGNERAVNETIDRLYHIGCDVITTARRADPRLRPRLRRGGQADAQPRQAALRDAVPRRPQADPPARQARRGGRASTRSGIFKGENGLPLEIDERGRALRRARAGGDDLRRRRRHRRPGRRRAARPAHALAPTASSSWSRRSPSRTARRSPSPR